MIRYLVSLIRNLRTRGASFGLRREIAQWESEGGRLKEVKTRHPLDWITTYSKRIRNWLAMHQIY